MINQVAMGCKPNPTKFKVVHLEHLLGKTIVIANYGGETFDGDKLMVLWGEHSKFETLDPHFLNLDYPVFARFQPTKDGLDLARKTCMQANYRFVESQYKARWTGVILKEEKRMNKLAPLLTILVVKCSDGSIPRKRMIKKLDRGLTKVVESVNIDGIHPSWFRIE